MVAVEEPAQPAVAKFAGTYWMLVDAKVLEPIKYAPLPVVPVALKVEVEMQVAQVRFSVPLFESCPPPPKGAAVEIVMEAL